MKVILLEKVQNLGGLGDAVKVKPGYARNFLIPQGKAVPATSVNLAQFEARRAELERQEARTTDEAKAKAETIEGLNIEIARKTADEGRLFGSVTTADIVEALTAATGVVVRRQDVRLSDSLRQVGDYTVGVQLYAGVEANVNVKVVPEA